MKPILALSCCMFHDKLKVWTRLCQNLQIFQPIQAKHRDSLGQAAPNPTSFWYFQLKAWGTLKAFVAPWVQKCYQTCRLHRWHWVTGATPQHVWFAVGGWWSQGCASGTHYVHPELLCADQTPCLQGHRMSPPFFVRWVRHPFHQCYFTISIHKTHNGITSHKQTSTTTTSHAVFPQAQRISCPLYCSWGFSSILPIYAYPLGGTKVCTRKQEEVLWRLSFLHC